MDVKYGIPRNRQVSASSAWLLALAIVITVITCCSEDSEVTSACKAVCDRMGRCLLDPLAIEFDAEGCVDDCIEDYAQEEIQDCLHEHVALGACMGRLACGEGGYYSWLEEGADLDSKKPCVDEGIEYDECKNDGCYCAKVERQCTYEYDSFGTPTETCTCVPACCC